MKAKAGQAKTGPEVQHEGSGVVSATSLARCHPMELSSPSPTTRQRRTAHPIRAPGQLHLPLHMVGVLLHGSRPQSCGWPPRCHQQHQQRQQHHNCLRQRPQLAPERACHTNCLEELGCAPPSAALFYGRARLAAAGSRHAAVCTAAGLLRCGARQARGVRYGAAASPLPCDARQAQGPRFSAACCSANAAHGCKEGRQGSSAQVKAGEQGGGGAASRCFCITSSTADHQTSAPGVVPVRPVAPLGTCLVSTGERQWRCRTLPTGKSHQRKRKELLSPLKPLLRAQWAPSEGLDASSCLGGLGSARVGKCCLRKAGWG